MRRLVLLLCLALRLADAEEASASAPPRGHLQHLGEHRDPDPVDEIHISQLTSEYFLQHVYEKKPLVIRECHSSPAMNWTFPLIREKYGELVVQLEPRRETFLDRKYKEKNLDHTSLEQFVDKWHKFTYVVSQTPGPMLKDIRPPAIFNCEPLNDAMLESDIWISDGNTSSALHKDALNTLNMQMVGSKEWILIDHTEVRKLPMAHEGEDPYEEIAGFSSLDVKRVDLIKYPDVATVRWRKAVIQPGDALFVPGHCLHQVESSENLNVASTLLFSGRRRPQGQPQRYPEPSDPHACARAEPKLLSELDLAFTYPGGGKHEMTMGWEDPEEFRVNYLELLAINKNRLSRKTWGDATRHIMRQLTERGLDPHHRESGINIDEEIEHIVQDADTVFLKLTDQGKRKHVTTDDVDRMPRKMFYEDMRRMLKLHYACSLYDEGAHMEHDHHDDGADDDDDALQQETSESDNNDKQEQEPQDPKLKEEL